MALATGNLTIVTDAMVFEMRLDDKGKAEGVNYIDRHTRKQEAAFGRTVVLAASAGETARILLNSKSVSFPDGAANSSGQVGRNLMDTVGAGMRAQFPLLENRPSYNEDGARVAAPVYSVLALQGTGARRTRFRTWLSLRTRAQADAVNQALGSAESHPSPAVMEAGSKKTCAATTAVSLSFNWPW